MRIFSLKLDNWFVKFLTKEFFSPADEENLFLSITSKLYSEIS